MTLLDDLKDKIKIDSRVGLHKFHEHRLDAAQQYENRFWDFTDNQISHTSLALLFMELEERIDELEEQLHDIRRQLP